MEWTKEDTTVHKGLLINCGWKNTAITFPYDPFMTFKYRNEKVITVICRTKWDYVLEQSKYKHKSK